MAQMSFFKHLEPSFPTNKQTVDGRKLRGGYYTPLGLAQYLVGWGLRQDTKRILEPSCGDGNFGMVQNEQNHLYKFGTSMTHGKAKIRPNSR